LILFINNITFPQATVYPLIKKPTFIGNVKVALAEDITCMQAIAIAQRAEKRISGLILKNRAENSL
jgi:hypothetical protein